MPTANSCIVSYSGRAGAGKDTIADAVADRIQSIANSIDIPFQHAKVSFATSLKRAASIIFNIPLEWFNDREKKERIVPFWNMTPREMAQQLGTEACREGIRDDIWLKSLESQMVDWRHNFGISSSTFFLFSIPDCRFDNEAQWVKEFGGMLFQVNRDTLTRISGAGHKSEHGINQKYVDGFVDNVDGDLGASVDCVLRAMVTECICLPTPLRQAIDLSLR